jgi:hypothetical protein
MIQKPENFRGVELVYWGEDGNLCFDLSETQTEAVEKILGLNSIGEKAYTSIKDEFMQDRIKRLSFLLKKSWRILKPRWTGVKLRALSRHFIGT